MKLNEKKLGIWMDHSTANIIEFTLDPMTTETIHSKFTHEVKENTLSKSENLMHNKEQNQQAEYYKELASKIRNYSVVLIFGPTNAKTELYNFIKNNHLFNDIKIEIKQTDKMTDKNQHEFVREYFSNTYHSI
jgi:stalled ribosome rescue protein Dom34